MISDFDLLNKFEILVPTIGTILGYLSETLQKQTKKKNIKRTITIAFSRHIKLRK